MYVCMYVQLKYDLIDQRLAWGQRGIRASETNIDYGAKLLLVGAK